jgi:protein gp37
MKTEITSWNPLLSETEFLQPLSCKKETMYILDGDLFENAFSQIDHVLALIALCPQHTFQLATKDAKRMEAYFTEEYKSGNRYELEIRKILKRRNGDFVDSLEFPLPNLWLGVQIENQEQADVQIPFLLETPAAVRFVLCEPLLGKIDFTNAEELNEGEGDFRYHNYLNGLVQTTTNHIITEFDTVYYLGTRINWVIVGANGKNAQPMHPDWVRGIKKQCKAANVPFKEYPK